MTPFRIALAALAAIAVQPLVLVGWIAVPPLLLGETVPLHGFGAAALVAMLVATPFVLVIGVPAALLLRHHRRRGACLAAVGAAAAMTPLLLATSPYFREPADALPLLVGGLHGVAGALAFHATWRRSERPGLT